MQNILSEGWNLVGWPEVNCPVIRIDAIQNRFILNLELIVLHIKVEFLVVTKKVGL